MPGHEYAVHIARSGPDAETFVWAIVREADGFEVARSSRTFPTRAEALADSARAAVSLALDVDPVPNSQ